MSGAGAFVVGLLIGTVPGFRVAAMAHRQGAIYRVTGIEGRRVAVVER